MGNTVRSRSVLTFAILAVMTAPELAQAAPKATCKVACSSFISELVGNSQWSGSLSARSRRRIEGSIERMVRECSILCGLNVTEVDLLAYLEAALADLQEGGEGNSGPASQRGALPAAPGRAPASAVAVAAPSPAPVVTPPPVSSPSPGPSRPKVPKPDPSGGI